MALCTIRFQLFAVYTNFFSFFLIYRAQKRWVGISERTEHRNSCYKMRLPSSESIISRETTLCFRKDIPQVTTDASAHMQTIQ